MSKLWDFARCSTKARPRQREWFLTNPRKGPVSCCYRVHSAPNWHCQRSRLKLSPRFRMDPLHDFARFAARALHWLGRRCEVVVEQRAGCVRLRPSQQSRGTTVIFYITDPWRYPVTREKHYHTNRWECAAMADTFLEAGYVVDVVDYQAVHYRPRADCALAVDTEHSFNLYADRLPADCRKIYHAPTTHWLHWNRAELRRLHAIQQRRGAALK